MAASAGWNLLETCDTEPCVEVKIRMEAKTPSERKDRPRKSMIAGSSNPIRHLADTITEKKNV